MGLAFLFIAYCDMQYFDYICNIKSNQMKKLTKDEMSEYTSAKTNLIQLKMHLADIIMTEESIKSERDTTVSNIRMSRAVLEDYVQKIAEKYGEDAKINFQTGEISK